MSQLTVASFFTGAMGLDIGLERAGLTVTSACENDPHARATITSARPNLPLHSDIRTADPNDYTGTDVVVGGPPCQAFSTIGKRDGLEDARGSLLVTYLELATAIRPRFIVLENVPGMLSIRTRQNQLLIDEIADHLTEAGYCSRWWLLNAADFGAPQLRRRVIIIAHRNGPIAEFVPTHTKPPAVPPLNPWLTLRDALRGLCDPAPEHTQFSPQRAHYMRMLGPGQNWRNLPTELREQAMGGAYRSPGGKTAFFRRLAWDRPAPTLTTTPTAKATTLAHPEELRPLSVAEYLRIQGFPDNWPISGPVNAKYRQLGNAVPTPIGEAVGHTLRRTIGDFDAPPPIRA